VSARGRDQTRDYRKKTEAPARPLSDFSAIRGPSVSIRAALYNSSSPPRCHRRTRLQRVPSTPRLHRSEGATDADAFLDTHVVVGASSAVGTFLPSSAANCCRARRAVVVPGGCAAPIGKQKAVPLLATRRRDRGCDDGLASEPWRVEHLPVDFITACRISVAVGSMYRFWRDRNACGWLGPLGGTSGGVVRAAPPTPATTGRRDH